MSEKKSHAKTLEESLKLPHKFWNTQPVVKSTEVVSLDKPYGGEIELSEEVKLQDDFEWFTPDLNDELEVEKICLFLNTHYSNAILLKTHYTPSFLKHYLGGDNLFLGIRVKTNKIIVSFVAGTINKMQVGKYVEQFVDVNLLCVYPKLRNKNLASLIIKELKRRVNLQNYKYGIFTTEDYLLKPIASIQYFNRPINIKKLIDIKYIKPTGQVKIEDIEKTMELPANKLDNFVVMQEEHIISALNKLNRYLSRYNLHPIFDEVEFRRIFYNNEHVQSFAMLDDNKSVIDFISYYVITKEVVGHDTYIKTGFLYYYSSTVETVLKLIKNVLICARNNNIDLFHAFNIMENPSVIHDLMFEQSQLNYHYYLYNWKMKPLDVNQIGKIF